MASKKQTTNTPDDGVVLWGRSSTDSESIEEMEVTGGAAHTNQATLTAGERQESSATLSYLSVKEDWNYAIVDYTSDPVTVSAAPAILGAVFANTQLAGDTCAVKDDTTTVFTLPIAVPTTGSGYDTMKGTRFETSLIFDFGASASAGNYTVLWRLL